MSLPEKSNYPITHDDANQLKTVVDGLSSITTVVIKPYDVDDDTTYDWENGKGIIDLQDNSLWRESGYVTIYLKGHYGKAIDRSTLFHYGSKGQNTLEDVMIIPGQEFLYFPENSEAVQNVVAENHNYSKDALIALEQYLGNRGTEDQSTIEWFTNFYVHNVRVPKPWLNISSTNILTGEYITFQDLTTRIKPGFTINLDTSIEWIFDLGDETMISVSLDSELSEYVFNISWREILPNNNLGEILNKEERKSTWNRAIYHSYRSPGVYNVSLYVKNEFGTDQIILEEAIKVIDNCPESLTVNINGPHKDINKNSKTRAKANLEEIIVRAEYELGDVKEHVASSSDLTFLWDIPFVLQSDLPNEQNLTLNFQAGGMYYIGLKMIAPNESWIGTFTENAIDIVERPSVWLAYVSKHSGNLDMNEYSITSNTWKTNSSPFDFNYSYAFAEGPADAGTDLSLAFRDNKGFYSKPNTDIAHLLWSPNKSEVDVSKFDCMTNAFSSATNVKLHRPYNWYTLYMPSQFADRIYVLGGLNQIDNLSIMSQAIHYYDISVETFNLIEQRYNTPLDQQDPSFTDAFENAKPMIKQPNDYLATWKTANFEGIGYILRNSENSLLEDLFSFDPSTNIFNTVNTTVPFSRMELGFDALRDGIYTVSNAGDIHQYDPTNNVWTPTTLTSSEVFSSVFHTDPESNKDSSARVVTGVESRTSNTSNSNLYFSFDYGITSFGKYDSSVIAFQQLSSRPEYNGESVLTEQWDMTVF